MVKSSGMLGLFLSKFTPKSTKSRDIGAIFDSALSSSFNAVKCGAPSMKSRLATFTFVCSRFHESSREVGVYWYKPSQKWIAKVTHNHKNHHLGYFTDEADASEAAQCFFYWFSPSLQTLSSPYFTEIVLDQEINFAAARAARDARRDGNLDAHLADIGRTLPIKVNKVEGVRFSKTVRKWNASVTRNGKQYHVGWFACEADAVKAATAARNAKWRGKLDAHLSKIGMTDCYSIRGRRPGPAKVGSKIYIYIVSDSV